MNTKKKKEIHSSKFAQFILLIFVLAIILLVLVYVGYVDGTRVYTRIQLERFSSKAALVSQELESRLQKGVPLTQIIGFQPLTERVLVTDRDVMSIEVINTVGATVFNNIQSDASDLFEQSKTDDYTVNTIYTTDNYDVYSSRDFYQIWYQLRDRFGVAGRLQLSVSRAAIENDVRNYFRTVLIVTGGVMLLFSLIYFWLRREGASLKRLGLNIMFGAAFLVMAVFLLYILVQLYSDGIQKKAEALSDYMANRLNAAFQLGLTFRDFEGVDDVFNEYRELNPEISYISLIENGVNRIHTDSDFEEREFSDLPNHFNYSRILNAQIAETSAGEDDFELSIGLGIPQSLVFRELLRNIRNFAVLFLTSAFIAWMMLKVFYSIDKRGVVSAIDMQERQLELIYPVFFLDNFMEGLLTSFLPQYLKGIADSGGFGSAATAGVFTCFFAAYAIILVPAGRYAQRQNGIRQLLILGLILRASSMVILAMTSNLYLIYLIRIISGLGYGMIFIAVQSYILYASHSRKATQGITLIVYGYNGGIIAGTSMGSLLIVALGFQGVFFIAAAIGLLMLWYVMRQIRIDFQKNIPERGELDDLEEEEYVGQPIFSTTHMYRKARISRQARKLRRVRRIRALRKYIEIKGIRSVLSANIRNVRRRIKPFMTFTEFSLILKDTEFIKTILLVGIITKAVLTGVMFFATPLILESQGYLKEDIGQILMFYVGGVLLASKAIARVVDRSGKTKGILSLGAILGGVGIIIIGLAGYVDMSGTLRTIAIIVGMLITGLSHGCIHAPVVRRIADTNVAKTLGKSTITSIYRFMERLGHVIGPLAVNTVMVMFAGGSISISFIGVTAIMFGVIFMLFSKNEIGAGTGDAILPE